MTRTLHSRSLVYTLADHPGAARAQAEAIAAYPAFAYRRAAQVQLHVAMSAVRAGDLAGGLEHARRALDRLQPHDMTRYLLHTAATVVNVLPSASQAQPAVIEYREMLALPGGS
ncbi:hypothetical protein OG320_05375 [Microbispora sp. NBC_01189]|uniref:hypothetical protein n=1 Tax=Microbispora sp. NBC_01189 TaxID=2903583 RepID=UPI002E11B5DC|nr:hypothetical protein OG320_05375 [Microbispora sp. NBC_01189]